MECDCAALCCVQYNGVSPYFTGCAAKQKQQMTKDDGHNAIEWNLQNTKEMHGVVVRTHYIVEFMCLLLLSRLLLPLQPTTTIHQSTKRKHIIASDLRQQCQQIVLQTYLRFGSPVCQSSIYICHIGVEK